MLDLTGIMFSSLMLLVVIIRAVQLDRSQAWFQTVKREDSLVKTRTPAWRRPP
ncbi:MAG TPA: hypothetical protein VGM32_17315 [Rhodopila sp.]|jgi:hypothetical protein